ncbi:MAG TPA: L,D-transpeptidase family protein [Pyrinomonadaceae bacterium]|nr:L,D-transpeptidase family protein [Pyrinomonadaceae bacterium]
MSALILVVLSLSFAAGCEPGTNSPTTSPTPSPSPSASPTASPQAVSSNVPVTLPVLDALFSDEAFKTKLKSQVDLTDTQVSQLQKVAADEVARLRQSNIEDSEAEPQRQAEEARHHASQSIRDVVGEQKADAFFTFVRDYWTQGGESTEAGKTASTVAAGPNSVPKDTRVVVNIPAYRMDVFREGTLVKSYKIGIGYPEFPLPTGQRKASTIIFNPTWTPPDEPWVDKMKGVAVGEKVAAGSKLNPLGPIKIPIGLPSLIHGGKSMAKLGTFASHGCVGLTTPQVQDFSKLLAQLAGGELTDSALQGYAKDKTKTEVVKLNQAVPVELRYETIVVEDGKLKIYRDVYDQDTNTEENLRKVLEAHGVKLEDLSEQERTQVLDTLNAMSATSTKAKPATATASPSASPEAKKDKKTTVAKATKPIGKNQKEVVIEVAALKGKGYPTAVNFDTGTGKPAGTVAVARPTAATPTKKQ